jgi:Yip1 domain
MNLVDRVKKLLLQPKQEWAVIAAEPHTVQGLYTQYVIILAAIPAVAMFIGFSLIGAGFFRVSIGVGIAQMILSYLLSLGAVYVLALLIDALAPNFGGEKNFMQALKVAAFSMTASWLAGIFYIVPALSILALLGLYSFYLMYLGLPMLMKAPEDKAVPYLAVVIIAAIVLFVVAGTIANLAMPSPARGY